MEHLQRLLVAAETPMVIDADDLEFFLLPPGRDAQDEPPTGEDIEQGSLLCDVRRLEQRQQQHAGADVHALGFGDQTGERLERRQPNRRSVGQVMADGDAVVAELPGEAHLLEMLVHFCGDIVARSVLRIDEQRQLHGHPPARHDTGPHHATSTARPEAQSAVEWFPCLNLRELCW